MSVPTPHNTAVMEEISNVVLMPGDPMRSKYIAEAFLQDAVLFNNVRGVQGYTGTWKGKRISVMSSGMGIPSISIYAYELYNFYETDLIIRVGTAGSICSEKKVGDVLFAQTAYTDSNFLQNFTLPSDYVAKATQDVLDTALSVAGEREIKAHVGAVLTQEIYYSQQENIIGTWQARGVDAFEMEAAALYANAAQAGKKALALFTISNDILTGVEMDVAVRERALNDMITIGLDTAAKYAKES